MAFARLFALPAGLRAASRNFARTPLATRQAYQQTFRSPFEQPRLRWQSTFRPTYRQSRIKWAETFKGAQTRAYRRQAFNYQTFQGTKNVFRQWAMSPTFYYQIGGITVFFATFYIYNLEEVPVSGRYRFNVISPAFEKEQGDALFQQTLQEYGNKIMGPTTQEHRLVQKVLNRLIPHSGLQDEQWEIHVINDPQKNAFVIPGGKVFVFRGILDVCEGEDGLAAVLGHEIAHNVAHHAAERMSQSFIFLPIAMIGSLLLGIDPGIGKWGADLAFTLPGSRKQEAEADYIGLQMMAASCFDPHGALRLWANMEKEEKGAPPQFLSTHPSSHNRLEKIEGWLPKAEQKRAESECGNLPGMMNDFRQQQMSYSRF